MNCERYFYALPTHIIIETYYVYDGHIKTDLAARRLIYAGEVKI